MSKLVVANWKMNPQTAGAARKILRGIRPVTGVETVVCPPFPFLHGLGSRPGIKFGAQDVFWEPAGAYTGEVSAGMLQSGKAEWVIVGHSERRRLGDSDEAVNKKLRAALRAGLPVILCVGEPAKVRAKGPAAVRKFVGEELRRGLQGVKDLRKVVVAYEPIWAVSTNPGSSADRPEDAAAMVRFVKGKVPVRALYGGSIGARNAGSFLDLREVDGALVGGASLKPEEFNRILAAASGKVRDKK